MTRTKKTPRPTEHQTRLLGRIARFPLMKSLSADRIVQWGLTDGTPVNERTAAILIRNGWVKPQRDGLGLFDDAQTYVALKPDAHG